MNALSLHPRRLLSLLTSATLLFAGCKKDPPLKPIPPVKQPPTITSISPNTGLPNTMVTITGINFRTITTDNLVKFNGVAATVSSASTTQLQVSAPATGTTGAVTVQTTDGTATGPVFTYLAATVSTDIYVCGRGLNGPGYWKNGVFTSLTNCLEAWSMAVSASGDIYVAGADKNGPAYWVNGTDNSLPMTAGDNDGRAKAITLSGTDVYIGGYDFYNGAYSKPRCWKNGVAMAGLTLPGGYGSASINGIFVSGTDVYLAGDASTTTGIGYAAYWKNGTLIPVSDGTAAAAEGFSVFVNGSDVYVCGYEENSTARHYWKNSTAVLLNTPTTTADFEARAICLSGSDVYVAGEYDKLSKYWKNGVMTDLTSNAPSNSGQEAAYGMTVNGTDIYIVGTDMSKGAGYWKNGTFTGIPDAQFLYSIVIK